MQYKNTWEVRLVENKKLNMMVLEYQNTRNDDVFSGIYNEVMEKIHHTSVKVAKSISAAPEEVIAIYQDTLIKCVEKYDGSGNFRNFFNASAALSRRYLNRTKQRIVKNECFYEDLSKANDESEAATFDIRDEFDLEHAVVSTKKADQWQLIDFLTKDCDAETTAIVQAYMTLPKPNPLAVEKATGICRKKVARKLNRLAARFSTKQFGDYTDYLIAL